MMAGMAAAPAGPAKAEEEEEAPAVVQTSFTLKLDAFAADKKVALIKEIKANMRAFQKIRKHQLLCHL